MTNSGTITVTVHPGQFPDAVNEALRNSLRTRQIPPKFHYQSYKQAELWLALHRACSPAWTDPDCKWIYHESNVAAAALLSESRVEVIGLGCGGGAKEAQLLSLLAAAGNELSYLPCDVSLPLLLTAAGKARSACPNLVCRPLLCDLTLAADLAEFVGADSRAPRVITFFGMMPNLEPDIILPKLAGLLRPNDLLLLSANLAPGPDYRQGLQRVLPGYDNPQTRAWLRAFLEDLGAEREDGVVNFSVEQDGELLKIAGDFHFTRERELVVHDEHFQFNAGDKVRLFFSYRHTPTLVHRLLKPHGLRVVDQWVAKSGEEGVFLCRKLS